MIGAIEMTQLLKIGCFGVLALLAVVVVLSLALAPKRAENLPDGKPHDIRVTSVIVKGVDSKFRYFFDVRNHDGQAFAGEVKIVLLNSEPGVENGDDTFSAAANPIQPNVGRSVFLEAHTGPASVHGDACVAGFRFVAVVDGKAVARGTGAISERFEKLD